MVPAEAAQDQAEGLGHGYREDGEVQVVRSDGTVTAHAYIATEKDKTRRPYHWYKDFIVAGAIEHGLPPDYVEKPRAIEGQPDPKPKRRARNEALLAEEQNQPEK
jgi:hypothetical protein